MWPLLYTKSWDWSKGTHCTKKKTQQYTNFSHPLRCETFIGNIFRYLTIHNNISFMMTYKVNTSEMYEGVSKSFRTGGLELKVQMVQLSATRCSCIAILWVSLVSVAAITFCVASQRVVLLLYNSLWLIPETFGYTPFVTTAWHFIRLQLEKTASKYGE
jgi:hypothetical protein